MVALKNINNSPELIKHLVASGAFRREPLNVVDVGARGGFESHWSVFGDQVRLIGFEADKQECEALNSRASAPERRFLPYALDKQKGARPFYCTANAASSGFYPIDMGFFRRFQDEANLNIVKTLEMATADLDSLAAATGLGPIDFIKLDTEGNELDILQGAVDCLTGSVLGVSTEVSFMPLHQRQPVFSDIDAFMRANGFRLYDLTLVRLGRKALPPIKPGAAGGAVEHGQVVVGQALFLRDGVSELEGAARLAAGWNDTRVLKLACLMELFCLPDCAVELIDTAVKKGFLKNQRPDTLLDLLVPRVGGKALTYRQYLELARRAGEATPGPAAPPGKGVKGLLPRPAKTLIRRSMLTARNSLNGLAHGIDNLMK
jgi:FkbM family methyltransferase